MRSCVSIVEQPEKDEDDEMFNEIGEDALQDFDLDQYVTMPEGSKPSIEIVKDVIWYEEQIQRKEAKWNVLTKVAEQLVGKCPICWVWSGIKREKHDLVCVKCIRPTKGYIAGVAAWTDMKDNLDIPKGYCFGCGLPTYDVTEEGHGYMRRRCEWDDFTVQLIFFIKINPDIWRRAKEAFPSLQLIGGGDEAWYKWLVTIGGPERLYNGLELVVSLFIVYLGEKK